MGWLFNAEIKIKNLSDSAIENWQLSFDFPHEITNIWNAQVLSWDNDIYLLKNMGWNINIDVGSEISFGFTAAYDNEIIEPSNFKIVTKIGEGSAEDYSIDFKVVSDWGNGFSSQMEIHNNSDKPIEAWKLKFDFEAKIDTIWGAEIISYENGTYFITNAGYNSRILPGESVIIGFNGSPGNIVDPVNYVLYYSYEEDDEEPVLNFGIELEVERDFREISASSGTQTVHFYAETFIDTDKIILIDAGTGSTVATMVDDGRRSKNGDELMNDNVYTCKVDIDISKEKIYELYAVIGDNGSDSIVSNTVNIEVYQFTEKDIFDNDQVLSTIENLYRSDEFKSMDLDSKIETMYNLLVELSENGTPEAPYSLIERDSIYFDKEHNQYTFIIYRGGIVVIPLVEFDENTSGSSRDSRNIETRERNSPIIPATIPQNFNTVNLTANQTFIGNALHLFGFTGIEQRNYLDIMRNARDKWNEMGLNTELDTDVTVNDFKKLKGYDIIIFNMHGNRIFNNYEHEMQSAFRLPEDFDSKKYLEDIKKGRISKFLNPDAPGYKLCILPSFFEYYYKDTDLNGSIIFMANCYGMGEITQDSKLSDALLNRGAESVVGFINSVYTEYGNNILTTYVNCLCEGDIAYVALSRAKEEHGEDDSSYGNKRSPLSYPIFKGDTGACLIDNKILNGNFENSNNFAYWYTAGDKRILSGLGELMPPQGNYMAFISTGIGSMEIDYLNSQEGSTLSQTFSIPDNVNTLSFTYNVLSEEPMEYVGSRYDDKFCAELYDTSGMINQLAFESVNTSTWLPISGIDFDGGDRTTFHTGWETVSVDISQYAGKLLTIKFTVFDVGDSVYDTGVLIDNVKIE